MSKKIKCSISFSYETIDPHLMLKATEMDNYDYVTAMVKGKKLICNLHAESVASLLNTINDLLSAMKLAETVYLFK